MFSLWEEERAKVLRERIEKARASKEETLRVAKDDIAKFYQQKKEALKKTQAANK